MEKLFVYGTLKKPEIQKSVFGRIAESSSEVLLDFTRSKIKINNNKYPIILPKKGRYVKGLFFLVSSKELNLIDDYETNSYRRQKVFLKSGKSAWVYMK